MSHIVLKSDVQGLGAHFQNHRTTQFTKMLHMTDIDSRYRAGRKSASSGDSALTPEPRPESFILDDLPLPVPGGTGSNATGRCKEVRGEKFLGKQVRGDKGGRAFHYPCPGGVGKKLMGEDVRK